MHVTKRSAAIVTSSVLAVTGGGAAYAFWTAGGSGTGTTTTGTTVALVVNQTSSVVGLYPGGSVALSGNFNNPNTGAIQAGSVTATVARVVKAGGVVGTCDAADYTVTGAAAVNAQIAAGTGVGSWSGLSLALANTLVNQDLCKGAVVTLTYTVT